MRAAARRPRAEMVGGMLPQGGTTMAKFINWVVAFTVLLAVRPLWGQQELDSIGDAPRDVKRIAVVLDRPPVRFEPLLRASIRETEKFIGSDRVTFPADKRFVGDGTGPRVAQLLATAASDPTVDLVWAFGIVASHEALSYDATRSRAEDGPRRRAPVLAPFIIDEKLQNIEPARVSARVSYLLWSPSLRRDLKTLLQFGDFQHVAVLESAMVLRAVPGFEGFVKSVAAPLGLQITIVPVESDIDAVMAAIPPKVDAVNLGPNPQLSFAQVERLAAKLVERKLPSFAWGGVEEVERGMLAGLASPDDRTRLMRILSLNTESLLRGEDGADLVRAFKMDERLSINAATARALGVSLGWDLTSEAVMVGALQGKVGRRLTFAGIVSEALDRNLDLETGRFDIDIADHSADIARAALLPRVSASLDGSLIDPDGATPFSPQRVLSWSANASQIIWDEASWSAFSVQQYLRDAAKHDYEGARLDTMQAAAVAYINVLLAKTRERIQRDNLRTTRELLSLSRVRARLGQGMKREVVRLESTLADTRNNVIGAVADRNIAEIEVNRLLNRPLEESFALADLDLASSRFMRGAKRFSFYLEDKDRFRALRAFVAREAIENSPELAATDDRIAAVDRDAKSKLRAFFSPRVEARAGVTHLFAIGGAGSEPNGLIPLNRFNWQLGVTASIPLYEGNARFARRSRVHSELDQLTTRRDAGSLQIRAAVRQRLHRLGAAWRAVDLTRDSADAAKENLRLVSASYGEGRLGVVDVLDAQNQALAGNLNATAAVYTFLRELMDLQRTMGRFEFVMSTADMASFFARLSRFTAERAAAQKDN